LLRYFINLFLDVRAYFFFSIILLATLNNSDTTVDIAAKAGVDQLSRQSITRRLNSAGLRSRIAAVKDVLTEEHRAGRIDLHVAMSTCQLHFGV
jgi:hypothetical protein